MSRDRSVESLIIDLERNTRYHAKRAAFLDFAHKFLMFLVVMLGSASISKIDLFKNHEEIFGVVIATVGALTLVFDYAGKAQEHRSQFRRYSKLRQELSLVPATENGLKFEQKFQEILSDESVGYYKALNAICHNEVMIAHKRPNMALKIGLLSRVFAQVFRFSNVSYERISS